MSRVKHTLRGSTLAEMLVMMLVAGIVFLTTMDGLGLFTRLQLRQTEALLTTGRGTEGFYRAEGIVSSADSIGGIDGRLEVFRSGARSVLTLRDSVLLYESGTFRDTLLVEVEMLRIAEYGDVCDTVEIGLRAGFVIRFAVPPAVGEEYEKSLDEIERDHEYTQ